MRDFIEFCVDLHKERWFKKNWMLLDNFDASEHFYSYIKDEYYYKHNGSIHTGILHCRWYSDKKKFEAEILDVNTYERIVELIPERDCKNPQKVYLLYKICERIENKYKL